MKQDPSLPPGCTAADIDRRFGGDIDYRETCGKCDDRIPEGDERDDGFGTTYCQHCLEQIMAAEPAVRVMAALRKALRDLSGAGIQTASMQRARESIEAAIADMKGLY